MENTKDTSAIVNDERTIGEMIQSGEIPDITIMDPVMEGIIQQHMVERFIPEIRKIYKLDMLDMLLPNGTRFGDAMLVDLLNLNYADKTMDEIAELLVDAPDEDEAEFFEDGPNTTEPDFITEEEDENPSGVVPRRVS